MKAAVIIITLNVIIFIVLGSNKIYIKHLYKGSILLKGIQQLYIGLIYLFPLAQKLLFNIHADILN